MFLLLLIFNVYFFFCTFCSCLWCVLFACSPLLTKRRRRRKIKWKKITVQKKGKVRRGKLKRIDTIYVLWQMTNDVFSKGWHTFLLLTYLFLCRMLGVGFYVKKVPTGCCCSLFNFFLFFTQCTHSKSWSLSCFVFLMCFLLFRLMLVLLCFDKVQ